MSNTSSSDARLHRLVTTGLIVGILLAFTGLGSGAVAATQDADIAGAAIGAGAGIESDDLSEAVGKSMLTGAGAGFAIGAAWAVGTISTGGALAIAT